MSHFILPVLTTSLLLTSGCATMIRGTEQPLQMMSARF